MAEENGGAIITGVVVGIGLIFGWQQWQNHKLRQAHSAAELYHYVAQGEADPAAARSSGSSCATISRAALCRSGGT